MSEWISVKDRLPFGGRVLIFSKHGGVAEGNFNAFTRSWRQYRWSVYPQTDVTHWMPLPEPPKDCDGEAD